MSEGSNMIELSGGFLIVITGRFFHIPNRKSCHMPKPSREYHIDTI